MTTVAQPTPHTPTPWSVDPVERADIRGADGLDVAIAICKQMGQFEITPNTCGPATRIHAGANAAHIVHCVNSFDALTEANKKLRELLREWVSVEEQYGDPHNAAINEIWLNAKTFLEQVTP